MVTMVAIVAAIAPIPATTQPKGLVAKNSNIVTFNSFNFTFNPVNTVESVLVVAVAVAWEAERALSDAMFW